MKDLTDEEYDALDEYYTKNPPKIDFSKNRIPEDEPRLIPVDFESAKWILLKCLETDKTSAEVVSELIQREKEATRQPVDAAN